LRREPANIAPSRPARSRSGRGRVETAPLIPLRSTRGVYCVWPAETYIVYGQPEDGPARPFLVLERSRSARRLATGAICASGAMVHDYYPLLARAVAGLEENTAEARLTIYERARSVLRAQMRDHQPSLPASERMDEMLALEQAIRKVETEAILPPAAPERPAAKPRSIAARLRRWLKLNRGPGGHHPGPGPTGELGQGASRSAAEEGTPVVFHIAPEG
jgi:hypothetical protein